MSGEKDIDMTWNSEKDLLLINSLIKTPFWKEASQLDFNNKCHLRELLQKCSGGKIVEMLKWLLSAEEKTALVKNELQSFFQSQAMQSFENHINIKYEVEVKQEPGSEHKHEHESSSFRNLSLKKESEPEIEIKHEVGPETGPEPGRRLGPKVLKGTDALQRIFYQDQNSGTISENSQSNESIARIQSDIKKSEATLSRGPNQGILDHERKRKLEVKCLELEDVLKDQGCDDEEIEEKVEAYRQMLLGVDQDKGAFQDVGPNQGILDHERERKLEVKCLELEDILKDLGCNDEEIEECTRLYMQLE